MENQYNTVNNKLSKLSRISWGAIIAGALTAISVTFLLNLLGLGIGLTTIDPMSESNPMDGLGTGSIIWWCISNLLALFAGGLVAGRMSGLNNKSDGGLHGFLAWSLYLILSIWLVSSAMGSIFNGMTNVASSIFSSSNDNMITVLTDTKNKGQQEADLSIENIKKQAFDLINSAENRNILPVNTSQRLRRSINEVDRNSQDIINDLNLDQKIDEFVNDLYVDIDENGNLVIDTEGNKEYINKEEVKATLTQNTRLTEEEIDRVINNWDRQIQNTVDRAETRYNRLKTRAVKVADDAADAAGKYGIIAFVLFLLGAIAAIIGGTMGSPLLTPKNERIIVDRR